MMRYVHTNIIAKDSKKLIDFYKNVLGCKSIDEKRDLRGDWLDKMTGLKNAHITGEHLCLPGYENTLPTLEIFSYDSEIDSENTLINKIGLAHIAFEVDDVEKVLNNIINAGGGKIGEVVDAVYDDGKKEKFVYTTDIEGNIIELQSWF